MFSHLFRASVLAGATILAAATAEASPACVQHNKPFALDFDTITLSMTIAPGGECIQGLRWSTMQIYMVNVSEQPKGGDVVIVGSGFRYIAKPDFAGTDKFTLQIVGKNRHTDGASTVEITVSRPATADLAVAPQVVVAAAANTR